MKVFRLVAFIALTFLSFECFADPQAIIPSRLNPGDTVAIISPSFKVSPKQIDKAVERVKALGYRPYVPHTLDDVHGPYAGTWESRVKEIHWVFRNSKIKGVFALRGGAGASQLLDKLDYELIRTNPKILMGFSDLSALLNSITLKTGLRTFHGPMPVYKYPPFSVNYMHKVLEEGRMVTFKNKAPDISDKSTKRRVVKTIRGGKAKGRIYGGNLSVLSALLGTEYLPKSWKGKILFVEEVSEDLYRIDRMLSQLRLAGILDEISGFIFGHCTNCKKSSKEDEGLEDMLLSYFKDKNIPVYSGAMIGHHDEVFTIPIGGLVEVDATKGTIKMLEPATR